MNPTILFAAAACAAFIVAGCSSDEPERAAPAKSFSCDYPKAAAGHICMSGQTMEMQCTAAGGTIVPECPKDALLTCPGGIGTYYVYDQKLLDLYKTKNPGNPCADFGARG